MPDTTLVSSQPNLDSGTQPPRTFPTGATRPLPALAKRVMILGLDGATFDVLNPMMESGRMPNLKTFLGRGASGVLQSTIPPITPAAWTTFMTGKGPGRHGIIDFEKYDVANGTLSFNSTYEIREKTIWDLLSEKGLRVGSLNVPMTYPPRVVNGFSVSGFETPSIDAEFTYPRELKQEIFKAIPSYNYRTNWQRRALGGEDILTTNLNYISGSFDQGVALTKLCGEKYGWDVLMLVYKLVDNLQHKAWKYLDPRYADRFPREAKLAAGVFERLDQSLGELFEYADKHNAHVLIMSDHGHGSLDGKAQANLLLNRWGYLALENPIKRAGTRARHWMHRLSKGKATRFEQGNRGIERELAVDWARTRACVMHAGISGFLYLNVKGRGPYGIVEPNEYEALREEIKRRLEQAEVRTPTGETIRMFPEVHKTNELYDTTREQNPDMPDLLLVPRPGLAVVRKIRGWRPVRWTPLNRLEGTHRAEGVLAIGGPHTVAGREVTGGLVDIAPTVLAMLGLRVPADMEGRVLSEAFDTPIPIEHEPPLEHTASDHAPVYSEADEALLAKRLTDLGYLE